LILAFVFITGEVEIPNPSNTIGGNRTANFDQNPSGSVGGTKGDIPVALKREANGIVTGNSYVLGARTGVVTIYNGKGVVATFPLNKLLNIK
jgi:hypothetical protein